VKILEPFTFRDREKKILAQAFQALRIEVNNEMEALQEMLRQSLQMLRKGGRMSVISYHSLEDRMVKNFFRSGNVEGKIEKDFFGNAFTPFALVNRKVIVPRESEQQSNPRSRSAKLRIAEKIIE
jgi:16S rRNA (cytosine1402-N4)-methyltransferase